MNQALSVRLVLIACLVVTTCLFLLASDSWVVAKPSMRLNGKPKNSSPNLERIVDTIATLTKRIREEQSTENVSFRKFPMRFAEKKGLYKSYIHFNNGGTDWESIFLRRVMKILDINVFVTNFVVLTQIESQHLLETTRSASHIARDIIQEDRLKMAIEGILSFHDLNFNSSIPVYNFWPQRSSANSKYFQAYPINLVGPLDEYESMSDYMEDILGFLGLNSLRHKVKEMADTFMMLAQAFHIPADYDCASCNLALGAMMQKELALKYPSIVSEWKSQNSHIPELFLAFDKYAYSNNLKDKNVFETNVDPRSYYIFQQYFSAGGSIKLPMTWMMNTQENRERYPAVAQPFNVNNIDVSVLCNFLYGVSSHSMHVDPLPLRNDRVMQQMALNASQLIYHTVSQGLELKRPDLAMIYYPSVYNFYWFISRTSFELRNSRMPEEVKGLLSVISNTLYQALVNFASPNLLKMVKMTSDNECYWDDFLGDGPKKTLGEDRMYSSALAISVLLDTWTQMNSTLNKRMYLPNTPDRVKTVIDGGILYLERNLLTFLESHENAFFSGTIKGHFDYPFFYPSNVAEYLNGTKVNPQQPGSGDLIDSKLIVAVEGVIDSKEYQQMVSQKWFDMQVPTQFPGFEDSKFPFWSSPALTLSISQLVFSKYVNLMD
ncbi:hypothetical protein C9374_012912 [Naegleria lovaniensis]|uniref:Uncharacterized protein n=1 Tax=Naegleria lovaniensis TaxID=51637 RepID=A0AA88GFF7_NAELO|nr:uncharacterized protein C9374_012912 [Naegleria lovaniensis]KAG2373066.1 hypothetical protein C9374_012912 [Naegleria lovaniensis]